MQTLKSIWEVKTARLNYTINAGAIGAKSITVTTTVAENTSGLIVEFKAL